MNLYDAATEAVYGRMGASSDMPYENARRSRTMAYLNARSYAKAAVDAYREMHGGMEDGENGAVEE